jgi:hypothetical protein
MTKAKNKSKDPFGHIDEKLSNLSKEKNDGKINKF